MRVLVIPEDFRKDQYLLKPLFERLFAAIGRKRTRIRIYQAPLLGGVTPALNLALLRDVIEQHEGMTDIFVLCVDRVGVPGRRQQLDRLETSLESRAIFLAENAWEEVETWALAGLSLPPGWQWAEIRAEIHVKERYFDPLARQRGLSDGPGGGRKTLGEEAARRIDRIRQLCPEDFDALACRLEARVAVAGR